MSTILVGVLGSLIAGLATAIGAIPIFFTKNVSHKYLDAMLGFAAGVMLAATCFSLIIPSIEYGGGGIKGVLITSLGIISGGIMLDLIDKYAPHEHLILGDRKEGPSSSLTKVWLFIIAITIHNFPEGLAVGVGFGSGNLSDGISLALGIGLQNMPEGLAVALALIRENYTSKKSFLIALFTGLVEPIGGIIGASLVQIAKPILPFVLALAGGAMLFVISDEIIPETHEHGFERIATYGLLIGFIIMMIMDVTLG
ncbi:ZIP family zinc transporter [Clostridium tetanomorphum]|uniref:ZIP family metal transporter n=1 Tax=Clostridium tetanomorphum TaxID=1553 RepID=A0A923EEU2_CLOTT|nr:ZIP family metal transporter [Clostridium tetanomorphum]KAJ52507.1 gufA protein [Clostridium tetanomorphum DSM 665]MBC2399813.1 ZIP family metal transporter [Clostridium tetanomorphum]MBP1864186.1 ZIP family zinc transporter [Clostridium tetanomorphum]NRS84599.1 ZIP family zinc transporter [Clostridium tetanomorphum]NRZ97814.1 ZIP family zinc transporter [Clostridium tetanomorphum]